MKTLETIKSEAHDAISELIEVAQLQPGQLLVIGSSSSEMAGERIGTASNIEIAQTVIGQFLAVAKEQNIHLAFQCCEHLNRALVMEQSTVTTEMICNVVPHPHAGGAMATLAYQAFQNPVVVEYVKADAGLDVGDTFIGMHLKHVAVPVRLKVKEIGAAHVTAARVRPKYIGGKRARYDDNLM